MSTGPQSVFWYDNKATLSVLFVWSTRSSHVKKLCPTRKKNGRFSIFLYFFLQRARKTIIFLLNTWINYREFVYLYDKKLTLEHHFYFFLRCMPDRIFYFLFFFPRQAKRPLSELVNQTIYWVSPNKDLKRCVFVAHTSSEG